MSARSGNGVFNVEGRQLDLRGLTYEDTVKNPLPIWREVPWGVLVFSSSSGRSVEGGWKGIIEISFFRLDQG